MRTLLIDNYDSYTYNLFQVIAEVNGELPLVYYNDKITIGQISSMVQAGTVHSVVISPGPGTPNNSTDIGVCLDVLQQLTDVPILGICLGHQALALAHGASVVAAPEPVHGRLSRLRHSGHGLFNDIPSGDGFEVVRYHSLLVDERSLPDCLEAVCWTTGGHSAVKLARDAGLTAAPLAAATNVASGTGFGMPASGGEAEAKLQQQQREEMVASGSRCLLMGLAHRSRPHYGVQFHPESVATRYGIALLRNFRDLAAAHIRAGAGPAAAQLPPARRVTDIIGPPGRLPVLSYWPSPEHQRGATLRLLWTRLEGLLARLPGGSPAVFELLYSWADDTFWLDSAAADRGRFSYMGGRGGCLWRKLTYKLPPPPSTAQQRQPEASLQEPAQQPGPLTSADANSDAASNSSCGPPGPSSCATTTASSTTTITTVSGGAVLQHAGGCSGAAAAAPPCGGGNLTVETPDGRVTHMAAPGGFLNHLQGLLDRQRLQVDPDAAAALPFNFWGGLVGYLGYELKAECGGANAHAASTPDAVMWLADRLVAVDHVTGDVFLLAMYDSAAGAGAAEAAEDDAGPATGRRVPQEQGPRERGVLAASVEEPAAAEQKARAQAWLRETQAKLDGASDAGPHMGACSAGDGALAAAKTAAAASSRPYSLHAVPTEALVEAAAEPCSTTVGGSCWAERPAGCGAGGGGMAPGGTIFADAAQLAGSTGESAALSQCGGGLCTTGRDKHQQLDQHWQHCAGHAGTSTTVADEAPTTVANSTGQSLSDGDARAAEPGPQAHVLKGRTTGMAGEPAAAVVPFRLAHGRAAYLRNIDACQAALHAGESYEVCLTTALARPAAPNPPHLYRTLRWLNPAPYAAWLQCGAAGPTVCCSSPERFLRGDRGGLLEARPIKGTAARVAADPAADAAAACELAASEKERAENLMIVDLLRNDLGRVCEVGTVHVPGLMDIESYATVHQMVSTVQGVRRAGVSIVDCIRAAFPGGSMTGAPKVRTMQIIDGLEARPRGVYSGSIGFLSLNDTFDLNIVIRTAVIEHVADTPAPAPRAGHGATADSGAAAGVGCPAGSSPAAAEPPRRMTTIGAGGAIVVQSQPAAEYEEMRLKARALLRAVGLCEGGAGPVPVISE